MKKRYLLSVVVIGLVFGLVLTGCDSGIGDDDYSDDNYVVDTDILKGTWSNSNEDRSFTFAGRYYAYRGLTDGILKSSGLFLVNDTANLRKIKFGNTTQKCELSGDKFILLNGGDSGFRLGTYTKIQDSDKFEFTNDLEGTWTNSSEQRYVTFSGNNFAYKETETNESITSGTFRVNSGTTIIQFTIGSQVVEQSCYLSGTTFNLSNGGNEGLRKGNYTKNAP